MPAILDRNPLPLLSGGDRTLGTKGATAGLVRDSSLALEYGISQCGCHRGQGRRRTVEDDGLAVGGSYRGAGRFALDLNLDLDFERRGILVNGSFE